MKKRIVSLLLVLVMLVSLFPAPARATETDSNVDSGMTVEGTNGFGNLLSAELQAEYEEETQDTGNYSVLGLEITGNTAKVEYASMEEAVLVVALYSEDGMQLLTSGKTTVDPTEDIATVTIEGNMPEYFQASAYLVDTYDFSPLCASYDTPMYTREMQELLASTVEDYDADRVLQLDEDKTTNFAVYAEDTILIEEQPGVNTVASVNDETSTYVIENVDESITSLRKGDIFAYPYGDSEILIVKVASISVSGTTVTITGAEMEMEEVFSHVKIEATGNTADMQVREDVVIDGVTFEGLVTDGVAPLAWDDSISVNKTLQYSLAKEVKSESDYAEASVEISGSLGLKLKVEFSYYISWQRQFLELGVEVQMEAKVAVTGKAAAKIPLTPFGFNPIKALQIGFEPNLTLEFSGALSYSLSVSVAASLSYENEKGFNMQLKPNAESKLELEGSVFFGVDLNPGIVIWEGTVLDAEIAMPIGLKLEAKFAPKDTGTGSSIHGCAKCLDMDLMFEAKAEIKLKILDSDNLSKNKTYDFDFNFGDMYYSFDASRFGWGKCPYLKYRVTIQTCNSSGIVPNTAVLMDDVAVGTTNDKGVLTVYVPTGLHNFAATIDGTLCSHRANVSKAGKIVLKGKGSSGNSGNNGSFDNFGNVGGGSGSFDDFGSIGSSIRDQIPGEVTDGGKIVTVGTCGENLTWALTDGGLLTISGTGPMDDYDVYAPWYNNRTDICKVVIKDGVTSIGDFAFWYNTNLTGIVIPDSVTSIGEYAFSSCTSLTSIVIPDSVTSIAYRVFVGCIYLTGIYVDDNNTSYSNDEFGVLYNKDKTELIQAPGTISDTYRIPYSVTRIGEGAFSACDNLTGIVIPDSVTRIGEGAFSGCDNLSSITLPDGITALENYLFNGCEKLTGITIPGGVISIGHCAFDGCRSLSEIVIPEGVTNIGPCAFSGCTSLTSIVIPDSVTSIANRVFEYCRSLTNIVIPDSVTSIGGSAFYGCRSLASINIPDSVTSIGEYAFGSCTSLTSIVIPDSVTSIGECAFENCISLTNIVIPDSVTSIAYRVFKDCIYLTGIYVDDNNTSYSNDEFGVLYNKDKTELIQAPGTISDTYRIPYGVTLIGPGAFTNCDNLTGIVIPDGVTSIGGNAFESCDRLASVTIPDSVTNIEFRAFFNCGLTDVYYFGTEEQWNQIVFYDSGIPTGITIHFNSTGPAVATADTLPTESNTENIPELDAVYGGEYGTEELEDHTLKTASFSGLVPGEEYLLLALADLEAGDVLAADNLLYIDQAVAGEDGTLTFEYVQRTPVAVSYVMACGASNKNLNDAVITFPEMTADGTVHAVDPTVVYEGTTLTEGTDYVLLGDVTYSEAGTYTCFVRGVHHYTGLAECSYTVAVPEEEPVIPPTEPGETKPTEPEEPIPTEPKYDNPFEDVFEADYYYDPVLWAVDEGITNGMDATHFAPGGTCTRAQIVTFLWRANGSPASGGTNPFTDVPADAWYTDAVLWAVEEGITTGTSATTFSPDAGCTRGQVATFLWRSQGQPSVNGENIFTDIAPGAYYYDAVLWAVANGITNGMGEGLFAPDATCTRGQIVTFLYRAMA